MRAQLLMMCSKQQHFKEHKNTTELAQLLMG